MPILQEDICRKIEAKLAFSEGWGDTPLGRMARAIVDRHTHVPINCVAEYLGVQSMVLRRWLYGDLKPAAKNTELIKKVEKFIKILDFAYATDLLPETTNLRISEALKKAEAEIDKTI